MYLQKATFWRSIRNHFDFKVVNTVDHFLQYQPGFASEASLTWRTISKEHCKVWQFCRGWFGGFACFLNPDSKEQYDIPLHTDFNKTSVVSSICPQNMW